MIANFVTYSVYYSVLVRCENEQNTGTGTHWLMIVNKITQSSRVVIDAGPCIQASGLIHFTDLFEVLPYMSYNFGERIVCDISQSLLIQ